MNKIFYAFAKGKRRKECFNTLSVDDFCHNHSSGKIIFKYYHFDSDRCSTLTADPNIGFVPEQREESQNRLTESQACSPSASPQSFILEPKEDCSSHPCGRRSTFTSHNLPPVKEEKQYRSEEESRFKKQKYVIHISNSKNFHIGPQSTVNINQELSGNNGQGIVHTLTESKLNFSKLLDCEEKLNEDYIVLISQHLDEKWKEFGRNLGLKETSLKEQEVRNGSNGVLIAYDMMREHISQFPKTSLGFVIYLLSEIHCIQLIEILAQKLGSNI